mmetsp:Transcript_16385/g.20739  ORF Transcript_16385/g.20739 Transcript_16385/m.20739 type:complete len:113 (+) Transcript_16385:75-413(+)
MEQENKKLKRELDRYRLRVFDLEGEIERLKEENMKIIAESEVVVKQNERLNKKLKRHQQQLDSQNEHVESLKNLAAQDRQWLDTEMAFRQQQIQERRIETNSMAKRRATMHI